MAEPTLTAVVTLGAVTVTVPMLTAFGIPLGLRADFLVAGFAGSIVAITLLNTVPSTGDTWRELIKTTIRRMMVTVASSLTSGYLTPLVLHLLAIPDYYFLGGAFAVGGGAQQVMTYVIRKFAPKDAMLPQDGVAP